MLLTLNEIAREMAASRSLLSTTIKPACSQHTVDYLSTLVSRIELQKSVMNLPMPDERSTRRFLSQSYTSHDETSAADIIQSLLELFKKLLQVGDSSHRVWMFQAKNSF